MLSGLNFKEVLVVTNAVLLATLFIVVAGISVFVFDALKNREETKRSEQNSLKDENFLKDPA
jgi:hypothetical protein